MDRIPSLSWSEPAAEHHALNRRRQVRQTTRHIRRHHVLDENPEGLRKTGDRRQETGDFLRSPVSCLLSLVSVSIKRRWRVRMRDEASPAPGFVLVARTDFDAFFRFHGSL